jgi:hypothetical protein
VTAFAKISILCALLLGLVVAAYKFVYPTYTYRYRETIGIEIDGEVHTGSSVIEVTWIGGPEFGDVGPFRPRLRGQATFVDLGPRGAVVAALNNGESYGTASDGAINAIWLAANAFGNKSTNDELASLLRLRGRKDLTPVNMPRLIWFRDISDPKTARKLLVPDIPTIFGTNARLVAAYVEITQDPIVIDIDKKLLSYELLSRLPGWGTMQTEFGFALGKQMFIGDAP